jgi:hypothetical protein
MVTPAFCMAVVVGSAIPPPVHSARVDVPVVLSPGEGAAVPGLVAVFLRVENDSRCPEGARCAWAGEVTVAVELRPGTQKPRPARLVLGGRDVTSSVEAGGYTVRLVSVPPRADSVTLVFTRTADAGRATQRGALLEHILGGHPVAVLFDAIPADSDQKRTPLGTIKGGERYTVTWSRTTGWTATGYNKGTRAVGTWTYANGSPEKNELCVWGRVFRFDESGKVTDPEVGVVGRVSAVSAP